MKTVITFGTFDLFHIGHLRILEKARSKGDRLVVGVSSDSFNLKKKQRVPIVPLEERMAIVSALRCVDEVFVEESMELKQKYIDKYGASVLVMGDDWLGRFDMKNCDTFYSPRTTGISTTDRLLKIRLE